MRTDDGNPSDRSASKASARGDSPQSRYFERRDIEIAEGDIVVVSCMRNEGQRLPYFLDYYRRLGVDRFLLVDNGSTDGTESYLREQEDVEYFKTDASYRGSAAGRLWTQELADTYAVDRWVLTVDVDELLVFPGSELLTLPELCSYLDDNNYAGLFTVLLDLYSDRPLAETAYTPGRNFLDVCQFFETDTYRLVPSSNPPFLGVFGGPRGRLFNDSRKTGAGPAMKKVPLVRWEAGFSYIFSTHSHRFVELADITGALLHFKFFASFEAVAATDARRGDRRQHGHYGAYQQSVRPDLCFHGPHSRRYQSPSELVRLGVMRSTSQYAEFVVGQVAQAAETPAHSSAVLAAAVLPAAEPADGLTLRAIHSVWPIVSNPGIGAYFGRGRPHHVEYRTGFVRSMRRHIRVLDVRADHLLLQLGEAALHRWERSNLGLSVFVNDQQVCNVYADGRSPDLALDVTSLEAGVYRPRADLAGAVREWDDRPSVTVTVYLFDAMDGTRITSELGSPASAPMPEDLILHSEQWHPNAVATERSSRYSGVLEDLVEGRLRGWVYDAQSDRFDLPVCIYVNGRLARVLQPHKKRRELGRFRTHDEGRGGLGFFDSLPLGYFNDGRTEVLLIEAVIAGTNVALRRSPMTVPAGVSNARWDPSVRSWLRALPAAPAPASSWPGRRTAARAARAARRALRRLR